MYFLLNLSHYVKSYGHLCQFVAFFTMLAPQIWPCHVTQEANFEENLFFLILHLILEKVTKFVAEKLSTSEVISQKPHGEWKTPPPPSAFRVKYQIVFNMLIKCQIVYNMLIIRSEMPNFRIEKWPIQSS